MTVEEIKAKLPEAQVYELNPECTYMLVYDEVQIMKRTAIQMASYLSSIGINTLTIGVEDTSKAVRILEIKPEIHITGGFDVKE